jgi:hypothetical protein
MGFIHLGAILQADLPAVSQVFTPEALLLTTLTVGCLGVAVMLLSRPRQDGLAAEHRSTAAKPADTQPELQASGVESETLSAVQPQTKDLPPGTELSSAPPKVELAEAVNEVKANAGTWPPNPAEMATPVPSPASRVLEEKLPEALPAETSHRGPRHGASALIAKVASLLPAGTAAPGVGTKAPSKSVRGSNGFQPAGRFSRSQQAFLRIPIVLTGRDESGAEFREETCTLILLPQGAVIPMRQKVRAGERMTLSVPSRQKDVACAVFGALPGPDGRMLVEVEFPEPPKSMWPVSFPAWSGRTQEKDAPPQAARVIAPARAPAMDSSGS